MKSSKVLSKRSGSPLEAPKTMQISDRKKKSTSNTHLHNPYKKGIKQFQTYGKTEKKKNNNYLKQLLRNNGQSTNKYRIVTEPVQERLLYLGNNNFGNGGSGGSGIKPSHSKSKYELQKPDYVDRYLKLNIRTSNNSKQKLKTGESFHKIESCRNCQKYREQLEYMKKQLNKLCMDKILWKNGQLHLDDIRESLKAKQQLSLTKKNSFSKVYEREVLEVKKHVFDLFKDIESLSTIDYPKMLSLNVFKYDPFYSESPSHQQQQLKSLLNQLRNNMEGKITNQDLEDIYASGQESQHTKKILRNLKSRLNHYLRENLELKLKKQILERSQEITSESQDYLKKVIEQVLLSYAQNVAY